MSVKLKALFHRGMRQSESSALVPFGAYDLLVRFRSREFWAANESAALSLYSLIGEENLILNTGTRDALFKIMNKAEVSDFLSHMGHDVSGIDSPGQYAILKKYATTTKSSVVEKIFNYFSIEQEVDEVEEVAEEPVRVVLPKYGLFPHQKNALAKVWKLLEQFDRVMLHMPTGAGKTRTAMCIAARYLGLHQPGLVIWLADTRELCSQAKNEFIETWSHLGDRELPIYFIDGQNKYPISKIKDGLLVISLQTANSLVEKDYREKKSDFTDLCRQSPLVIFDEAHKAIAERYELVTRLLTEVNYSSDSPNPKLLGLSATPGRASGESDEDRELAEFFNHNLVTLEVDGYDNPVDYLIAEKYLAKPIFRRIKYSDRRALDVDVFKRLLNKSASSDEYSKELLEYISKDDERNLLIVNEILELAKRHKRILVFAGSVEQSERLAFVLNSFMGEYFIEARSITTAQNSLVKKRNSFVNWYKEVPVEGERTRILINYGMLTTGFDAPKTSAVVIARPTKSLILYSQMVGRGLRGTRANGNEEAEIVTIDDEFLNTKNNVSKTFENWNSVWSNPE